ncbi:hypothetical protein [Bacillus sp. 165]|uniref:hypothetical protein n=1 Tax=Bacillus sp. 165 TaxID=1529117 RepID=UPI001ADBE527|nr:hypothetical protein [Bacillus sp. 165]MBO9131486.1 hypothetical protein [Bacillus sp. 165]
MNTTYNTNELVKQVNAIEEAETALTIFNSKRTLSSGEKNLKIKKLGFSTLLLDACSPNSIYYNGIKGFGMKDLDKLDQILDIYASENIVPCFDLLPNQCSGEISRVLSERGFVCSEQLAFLYRDV